MLMLIETDFNTPSDYVQEKNKMYSERSPVW